MMNHLLWFAYGMVFATVYGWMLRFYRNQEDQRRNDEAIRVLKKHGLKADLYLATIGTEDAELRAAVDYFAFTGNIITNDHGEVVGKLCPSAKFERAPHLRLVVSND